MTTTFLITLLVIIVLGQQIVLIYFYHKYFTSLSESQRKYLQDQKGWRHLFDKKADKHLEAFIKHLDQLDIRLEKKHQTALEKAFKLSLDKIKTRERELDDMMQKITTKQLQAVAPLLEKEVSRIREAEKVKLNQYLKLFTKKPYLNLPKNSYRQTNKKRLF